MSVHAKLPACLSAGVGGGHYYYFFELVFVYPSFLFLKKYLTTHLS